jgi:tetratricopeptide (TPR) repeat protein
VARSAHREALSWFEQALDRLPHLPEGRDTLLLALDLRMDTQAALRQLSEDGRALEYLREAEAIAEALGDRRRQSGIRAAMADSLRLLGRYDEALEASQRALHLAEETGDESLRAFVMYPLAQLHRDRGELRRAANAFLLCVEAPVTTVSLRRFGLGPLSVMQARSTLAWTLSELGDFDEAVAHGTEGIRVCEASGNLTRVAAAYNILGFVHFERGDVARAVPLVERSLDLARTGDSVDRLIWAQALRGAAHTLAGQASLAIPLLERSLEMAAGGFAAGHAFWATWLGEAYLAAGRIADARQTVTDALARAVAQQERGNRAVALRALGEIAASEEPPDFGEAESRYRDALALAQEQELRPLQARCHTSLGKLCRSIGRLDEARAELATAVSMLREMEMAFWLPEAEAELAAALSAPVD